MERMEEKCLLLRLSGGFKTFEELVQASISLKVHMELLPL